MSYQQLGLRGARVYLVAALEVRLHLARCQNSLHRIVIAQEERGLFRLQFVIASYHARRLQHNLTWIAGNDAVRRGHSCDVETVQHNIYLRLQTKNIPLSHIVHADSRAAGLRYAELNLVVGVSVSGLLIENQSTGFEMNRVLQFFGRNLVGIDETLGIGLQIDLNGAFGGDIAGSRIVFEIGAVNLIEPAGIASIKNDVHIVQLGVATLLELHCFGGAYGENGASLLG